MEGFGFGLDFGVVAAAVGFAVEAADPTPLAPTALAKAAVSEEDSVVAVDGGRGGRGVVSGAFLEVAGAQNWLPSVSPSPRRPSFAPILTGPCVVTCLPLIFIRTVPPVEIDVTGGALGGVDGGGGRGRGAGDGFGFGLGAGFDAEAQNEASSPPMETPALWSSSGACSASQSASACICACICASS